MIMPLSAMTPRMATKPSGAWNSSSAATTPISPSGAVRNTIDISEKLCSCSIRMQQDRHQHHRRDRHQRRVRLVAFLDRAAHIDAIAGRQLRLDLFQRAAEWPASPTRPVRRPSRRRER